MGGLAEPANGQAGAYGQVQEIEEIEPDAALLRLAQVLREEGYWFTTVSPATHALVNSRP